MRRATGLTFSTRMLSTLPLTVATLIPDHPPHRCRVLVPFWRRDRLILEMLECSLITAYLPGPTARAARKIDRPEIVKPEAHLDSRCAPCTFTPPFGRSMPRISICIRIHILAETRDIERE